LDTAVASAGGNVLRLCRLDEGGPRLGRHGLGGDGLGCAGDDPPTPHEALDQPVVAPAEQATVDTGWAEVKVAIVAGAAVVVLVGDRTLAAVAVDGEAGGGVWGRDARPVADGILALVGHAGKLSKPLLSRGGAPGDRCLGAGGIGGLGSYVGVRSFGGGRGAHDGAFAARAADQQTLKVALEVRDRLEVACGGAGDRRFRVGRRVGGRLGDGNGCLFRRTRDLILDSGGLRDDGFPFGDGGPETQLQFGLGSTVELLVDGAVVGVEGDEGGGTVGVALEEDIEGGRDLKQVS
jgi:hypothetical protein